MGFEGLALVWWEEVAVPDEEEMGLGGRAEGGAGEGEVGGAAEGLAIGRVTRDFGERADDGLQVTVQDLREQIVHVGEVAADGARGGAHRAREIGQADGGGAMVGHEALSAVHDAGARFLLAIRGGRALAVDVIALGAEDAGWGVHGREDSERRGNAASADFGGCGGGGTGKEEASPTHRFAPLQRQLTTALPSFLLRSQAFTPAGTCTVATSFVPRVVTDQVERLPASCSGYLAEIPVPVNRRKLHFFGRRTLEDLDVGQEVDGNPRRRPRAGSPHRRQRMQEWPAR